MSSGFVAGTLVHTDKGLVPIQNLQVDDLVLSIDENNFKGSFFARVKSVSHSKNSSISTIFYADNYATADDGYQDCHLYPLLATGDNQLWIDYIGSFNADIEEEVKGWQKFDDILHGYEIMLLNNEIGGILGLFNLYEAPFDNIFYTKNYESLPNYLIDLANNEIQCYFIEHLFNENLTEIEKKHYIQPGYFPKFGKNIQMGDLTSNLIKNFHDFYVNRLDDKLANIDYYCIKLENNHTYFVGEKGLLIKNSTIQGTTE